MEMASYLLRREQGGCRFAPQSGAVLTPRVAAACQPTMLSRSQTLGFEPWIKTKGLNPGRRYFFAKTAAANKIMLTKAMNATVT